MPWSPCWDASAIEELRVLRALLEADTLFHAVDKMTEATFRRGGGHPRPVRSGAGVRLPDRALGRVESLPRHPSYQAANRPQALEPIAQINLELRPRICASNCCSPRGSGQGRA